MSNEYDVHFIATASDFYRVEANSPEEAERIFKKILEDDPEYFLDLLRNSIAYVEIPNDVTVDDVVEV